MSGRVRSLLLFAVLGVGVVAACDLSAASAAGDREPAYAVAGQAVEGRLYPRTGGSSGLDPCRGGSRENAAWLIGMKCQTNGYPNPLSAPVVLLEVSRATDLNLAVVAAPDSVLEYYRFSAIAPGTYSFQSASPILGIGDAVVRLYLNQVLAGEAETHLVVLGGVN